jgi:divalent metal cation (Fe/Co/Zn/Cd) transporter
MDLVLTVVVAIGLLVALWPWLLLAAVVAVVAYLLWSAIRRRRGYLD